MKKHIGWFVAAAFVAAIVGTHYWAKTTLAITIDGASLTTVSSTPTITGSARGLDFVNIQIQNQDGGEYLAGCDSPVSTSGSWRCTVEPKSNTKLVPGSYTLYASSFAENKNALPPVRGTLVIEPDSQGVSASCPKPSIDFTAKPSFGLRTAVGHSIELSLSSNQPNVVFDATSKGIKVSGIQNGLLFGSAPQDSGTYPMTITATSPCGATAFQELSFEVLPSVTLQADSSYDKSDMLERTAPGPTILYGESVMLSWNFSGSSDCTISTDVPAPWSGTISTAPGYANGGKEDSGALTKTTTYTLTCTGPTGLTNDHSVQVTVLGKNDVGVDLDGTSAFDKNKSDGPVSVVSGNKATLTWKSQNAKSCALTGSNTGTKTLASGTSGSYTTDSETGSTTYRIDCKTNSGPVVDTIVVKAVTLGH